MLDKGSLPHLWGWTRLNILHDIHSLWHVVTVTISSAYSTANHYNCIIFQFNIRAQCIFMVFTLIFFVLARWDFFTHSMPSLLRQHSKIQGTDNRFINKSVDFCSIFHLEGLNQSPITALKEQGTMFEALCMHKKRIMLHFKMRIY